MGASDVKFLFHLDDHAAEHRGPVAWVLDLDDPAYEHLANRHPPDAGETRRAGRYRNPIHGRRFLVGRSILREILRRHLGITEPALRQTKHGRLELAVPNGIDFNLSHSGNFLLIGVVRSGRIGVDVEIIGEGLDIPGIARGQCTSGELQWILSQPQPLSAFYRCWTAKEAVVKGIGLGVSLGLNQVETAAVGEELRIAKVPDNKVAINWNLRQRVLRVADQNVVAAVAFSD